MNHLIKWYQYLKEDKQELFEHVIIETDTEDAAFWDSLLASIKIDNRFIDDTIHHLDECIKNAADFQTPFLEKEMRHSRDIFFNLLGDHLHYKERLHNYMCKKGDSDDQKY